MKYLLLFSLLWGCSLFKRQPELSESAKETPEWIYAPYEACEESSELCATGEGKTFSQADAEARSNLASIFEVKVNSQLTVTSSMGQRSPWQGNVKQEVQRSLEESIDQVLELVQIKKHYKKDKLVYALASLDREKGSELVGSRLETIDDELAVLWRHKSRLSLRNIVRLYLEREKLGERYSILSGHDRPAPMTFKEIVDWRESRPKLENLFLRVGHAPDWMVEQLKELLTEAGFRIVKGNADKMVSLNVESIKEFLNVEGFEKYTFTMTLASFEKGEKNKVLSASETVSGRTQADALLKVKKYFTSYIEQHLSDLKLD